MSGSQLTRRSLFALLSRISMASGLVGAYGVLASFFARFLYPTRSQKQWYFLATLPDFPVGHSKNYQSPAGATVLVTRRAADDAVTDFIAFSSKLPPSRLPGPLGTPQPAFLLSLSQRCLQARRQGH